MTMLVYPSVHTQFFFVHYGFFLPERSGTVSSMAFVWWHEENTPDFHTAGLGGDKISSWNAGIWERIKISPCFRENWAGFLIPNWAIQTTFQVFLELHGKGEGQVGQASGDGDISSAFVGINFIRSLRQVLGRFRTKQIPHWKTQKKGWNFSFHLETWKGGHFFPDLFVCLLGGLYICPQVFRHISHHGSSRKCGWKCRSVRCELGRGRLGICKKNPSKNPRWRLNFKDSVYNKSHGSPFFLGGFDDDRPNFDLKLALFF